MQNCKSSKRKEKMYSYQQIFNSSAVLLLLITSCGQWYEDSQPIVPSAKNVSIQSIVISISCKHTIEDRAVMALIYI